MKTFAFFLTVLIISTKCIFSMENPGAIYGKVINKTNMQGLEYATVRVLNTKFGAKTKTDGTFQITNIDEGVYNLEITCVGFSKSMETSVRVVRGKSTYIKEILMEEKIISTEELVVTANKESETEAMALSYSYSERELNMTPGAAGEVLRSLEVLPGVSSAGGENSAFMVRGSSPKENIILVDGFPFSNITHFNENGDEEAANGGRFSIFSPLVVDNADFQAGGFSAKYGGKNASFLDLKFKDGNPNDFTINGTYDLLGWEFLYDGFTGIDNTSVIFSGKHHNYENIMKLINEQQHGVPQLNDYLFKITTDLGDHKFSLLGIYSDENMTRNMDHLYNYEEKKDLYSNYLLSEGDIKNLFGFSYRYLISDNSFLNAKVYYDNVRASGNEGRAYNDPVNGEFLPKEMVKYETDLFQFTDKTESIGSKIDLTYIFDKGYSVSGGVDFKYSNYEQKLFLKKTDTSYVFSSEDIADNPSQKFVILDPEKVNYNYNKKMYDYSFWSEGNLMLSNDIKLTPGIRMDYSQFIDKPAFSPRLAAKYQLNDISSLNFASGIYNQLPDLKYYFENNKLDYEKAYHLILGYSLMLSDDIRFTAESYYKYIDNIAVEGGQGTNTASNKGFGYAAGIDLSVSKRLTDNFFGQISYSYSVSKRNDDDGKGYYNSDFSIPHIFNILAGWHISNEWSVSARWKIASGLPTDDYIIHSDVLSDTDIVRYSKENTNKNGRRRAVNHFLNLRVDYRKQIVGRLAIVAFLDFLNIYDKENEIEVDFTSQTGIVKMGGLSMLPTFGFKLEF